VEGEVIVSGVKAANVSRTGKQQRKSTPKRKKEPPGLDPGRKKEARPGKRAKEWRGSKRRENAAQQPTAPPTG